MKDRANQPLGASANSLPLGVALWVLISASTVSAGWGLSAIHELNATGYAVFFLLLAAVFFWWEWNRNFLDFRRVHPRRLIRRFRRPLPLGFLALALIALLGGLLYRPTNYDALAYRVPRVLHWLAGGRWHWVHTAFPRLNIRACGDEWLMAPILAFTGNDRWLFLPSLISFLLLPGLFYSVFTRFGLSPRAAWHWMWIAATGYCYATQAGGIANDLFGATYALAAFDFALRVRQSRQLRDFCLFLISAALLTGAKASNIPLLLPLVLIVGTNWRLLLFKPAVNFLVLIFAGLSSFAPTAILNWHYCGDWTGMRFEGPMKGPITQLAINSGNWVLQNLAPPVFPFSSRWDHFIASVPGATADLVRCWHLPELVDEGGGGIGLGLSLLLIVSAIASCVIRRRGSVAHGGKSLTNYWKPVVWSPFISLLVFGLKAQAVGSSARLIDPYYAVLILPFLLFGFSEELLRRRWWKGLVGAVFVMAVGLVLLAPSRPLWPAKTVLAKLHETHPASPLLARAEAVYTTYAGRPGSFAPLIAALPSDETRFGLVTFDDPETSLWWPLGSRRIEHVTPGDTREDLERRGIKYILAPSYCAALSLPVEDVIKKFDAEIVQKVPLLLRVEQGSTDWYILRLKTK